jgi:hypothetical protein
LKEVSSCVCVWGGGGGSLSCPTNMMLVFCLA